MVCLDTEFLIAFLRGDERAASVVRQIESEGRRPATTILNAYELFKGALFSSRPESNLKAVRDLLEGLTIIPLGVASCQTAAGVHARLKRKGELVGEFDVLIAGMVAESQERLVSRDEHFARIGGLNSRTW